MTPPPRSVPGYELVRSLGQDQAVARFLARDPVGNPVVVEILSQAPPDAARATRLLEEARLCQANPHPHLVRHLEAGSLPDGRLYLVLEHLEARTLADHLRTHGPLSADQAVRLADCLANAIDHLQRLGVRRRTVAPHGVFLVDGPASAQPKLLDSPFAACLSGDGPGADADVRALGRLVFEALTAKPLPVPHEALTGLPPGTEPLASVLRRCLGGQEGERFGSASEAARALAAAFAFDRTAVIGPKTPTERSEAVPSAEAIGDILGSYELVSLLGDGASGRVYLARHTRLGRQVAVKVLRPEHTTNHDQVQRFFQEAQSVNQINHDHILEVYDFVEELGPDGTSRVYLVMELLQGKTLSDLLAQGPLSVRRTAGILFQVCQALEAAHRVGVVHRDVKPANIFLTQWRGMTDFVKVLDFGVAKLAPRASQSDAQDRAPGGFVGTPAYVAPEQALGKEVDRRADIYSAGTVLYECLKGKRPFQAPTFGHLATQVIADPPPPLGEVTPLRERIPPALAALAMRCLAKDPASRPQAMAEIAQSLAPYARARRRFPLAVAAMAGAALVAGTLVGLYALRPDAKEPAPVVVPTATAPPPAAEPDRVTLSVDSRPRGATVIRLDTGEALGTTPVELTVGRADREVPVRVELAGYQPLLRSVRLDRSISVEVTLQRILRRPDPRKAKASSPRSIDGIVDPFAQ